MENNLLRDERLIAQALLCDGVTYVEILDD